MAVMAFVALEDWEAARRAADWMLTFRYTYDVAFSPTRRCSAATASARAAPTRPRRRTSTCTPSA